MGVTMKKTWITFFIVALATGAVAGVLGALGTESYLARYGASLEEQGIPPRLGDERSRNTSTDEQAALSQVNDRVLPTVVRWHERLPETTSVTRGSYLEDEAIGSGVIVSSDGWILTSSDVFSLARATQIVAVVGANVYDVVEAKVDTGTEALFVKVGGTNLPVISFGESDTMDVGERVFVVESQNRFTPTFVQQTILGNDLVVSSEDLEATVQLAISDAVASAVVVNGEGELLGYLQASGAMRPLRWVLPSLRQVLRGEEVARARLGARVVMLDRAVGHEAFGSGALVVAAPVFGTPARKADVRANDVLTHLNGQEIGGRNTLARLLLDYQSEDIVTLTLVRDTETLDVDVELDARL